MTAGYSIRDAARLANLPEHRVRAYVRAGLVADPDATIAPTRPGQRRPRLLFQDLLVLRLASALMAEGLAANEVESALRHLKTQLPTEQPLSALRLRADAGRVVVDDGEKLWEPATGQGRLRLGEPAPSSRAPAANVSDGDPVVLSRRTPPERPPSSYREEATRWFENAIAHEEEAPQQAYEAYLHALEINPEHVEAMINVGRLCAAAGESERAAAYFRQALRADVGNPVANFNLGVTLHDGGDLVSARASYEAALASDTKFVDAHFNLAALLEQLGERDEALGHLRAYREIIGDEQP